MSQPSPEQIFEFYKVRLTEVLAKHNPSGVKTLDSLLKQFPGKEHQVYMQICKRFNVEPLPPPTAADFAKPEPQEQVLVSDGEVSKWLRANGFDMYASNHQFQTLSMENFLTITNKYRLVDFGVAPQHAQSLLDDIARAAFDEANKMAEPVFKPDFEVGESCFTKMMPVNSKGGEKWLNAKITHVNKDNTFDILVINAKSYGVPPEAVNVPRNMLKKSTEDVEIAIPNSKRKTKRPQFQQGNRVRVSGLRSHTTYNGLCGTVLLYVPSERRYKVRLDTNDVIAIKQRNVGPTGKGEDSSLVTPLDYGKRNPKRTGMENGDETVLSALMLKLMADNPEADAGKLGEFAAEYLLQKKKLFSSVDALPSSMQ